MPRIIGSISIVIGLSLAAVSPAVASGTVRLSFDSQWGWATYSADPAQGGVLLGPSEEVCLISPPEEDRCTNGGVPYGFPYGGWYVDSSAYPRAHFMWGPHINGTTYPASLAVMAFTRSFYLPGSPVSGSIQIAADDFAEVRVNGISAGTIGSITDIYLAGDAQSYLHPFDITAYLHSGMNTITVVGQNGPASYPGCPDECKYAQNPAMVIFTGTLTSTT